MRKRISFAEIETSVPRQPGLYEIYTNDGVPLKVGIGKDLHKRLLQHRASRQSDLKIRAGGSPTNPQDVMSKRSILAKHLYFDKSLTRHYNLESEIGRQEFLLNECYVLFEMMPTRQVARELERNLEQSGSYRYRGKAKQR